MKRAFIKNGWRPIYEQRTITKGKNKGRLEVSYRKGSKIRKVIIESTAKMI